MKKILSILFLAIFLFNLLGYYFVVYLMQQSVHSEMKAFIKKNPPLDKLERLVISDKEMNSREVFKFKDDKKEFVYNGKLYDIVKETKDGTNTIFYCINDKNEEQLLAGLCEHFKNNFDQNGPAKDKSRQLIKNIIKEALPDSHSTIKSFQSLTFIFFEYHFELTNQFIPVFSPPPEA
jgi:hypothetical protein